MSKTKYNLERQFIEGYNIVDAIDQATFQSQLTLNFNNTNSVDVDLSKSNFFIVDTGLCNGSVANFNFINYDTPGVQRFEILLLEAYDEEKELNFENGYPVKFPFKHIDDEDDFTEYDYEPMLLYQRRQMLITFRLSQNLQGTPVFVAVPTCWFESRATHALLTFVAIEYINDIDTTDVEPEVSQASRCPSNIIVQTKPSFVSAWDSFDFEKYGYESKSNRGVANFMLPRVPDYLNYDYDYRLISGEVGAPNYNIKVGTIPKEDTTNYEFKGYSFFYGLPPEHEFYTYGLDNYTIPTWEMVAERLFTINDLTYYDEIHQQYQKGHFVYAYWNNQFDLPYEAYGGIGFDSKEFSDGWYIFYCNTNYSYNKPPYKNIAMPTAHITPYYMESGFHWSWYLFNPGNNSYYVFVTSDTTINDLLASKYAFVKVTTSAPFDPTLPPLPPI